MSVPLFLLIHQLKMSLLIQLSHQNVAREHSQLSNILNCTSYSALFQLDFVDIFFVPQPQFESSIPMESFKSFQTTHLDSITCPHAPSRYAGTTSMAQRVTQNNARRSKGQGSKEMLARLVLIFQDCLKETMQSCITFLTIPHELQIQRKWMSKVMSIKFDVPPPEPNPFPVPMYTMPISTISSSSDASSPTLTPGTAPAPFCDDNKMI